MIGIFDSGSGGLSVLKEIRARLPQADILYLGDIANAPYGEKSQQELSALTVRNIQFLRSRGAARIVSACNSVSAALAVSLFDTLDITPDALIEMVGPTVRHFRDRDERVLLCATPATVRAGLYQQGFGMAGKELATVAIPELAGAIEFGASEAELERIVRNAFAGVSAEGNTLVLGCTHYPLVTPVFERVLGGAVRVFDPAHAVSARIEEQFGPHEAAGKGELHFAITKDSAPFRSRVASLWPESADAIEVVQ